MELVAEGPAGEFVAAAMAGWVPRDCIWGTAQVPPHGFTRGWYPWEGSEQRETVAKREPGTPTVKSQGTYAS